MDERSLLSQVRFASLTYKLKPIFSQFDIYIIDNQNKSISMNDKRTECFAD